MTSRHVRHYMLQDTQTYSTINQRKEIARPLSQVRVSLLVAYEMILKVAQEVLTGHISFPVKRVAHREIKLK